MFGIFLFGPTIRFCLFKRFYCGICCSQQKSKWITCSDMRRCDRAFGRRLSLQKLTMASMLFLLFIDGYATLKDTANGFPWMQCASLPLAFRKKANVFLSSHIESLCWISLSLKWHSSGFSHHFCSSFANVFVFTNWGNWMHCRNPTKSPNFKDRTN